jgi:CubicO group peptidase (beta-lactamase class C family)
MMRPDHRSRFVLTICVVISSSAVLAALVQASGGSPANVAERKRLLLPRRQLLSGRLPSSPVDDSGGFGMPTDASPPLEQFEGTLTLRVAVADRFTLISDIFKLVPDSDSPWKHLPDFSFQFVQDGNDLIPVKQGLLITGSPTWNYIVGPGRVWTEKGDGGYVRAALPFALVQRNQNCVHNGELTFLFSKAKSPPISHVYYQITQETCYPMKFNLWGMAGATYTPGAIAGADAIRQGHSAEIQHRVPVKPVSDLARDYFNSGFRQVAISEGYEHPDQITTYGFVINGVNYNAGCRTRFGEYAFCVDMRLPSYSIAKSVFASVALMRLGQLYGTGVYQELIKNFIPQQFIQGNWDTTTFNNASDMATGKYDLGGYEEDEDQNMDQFLIDESLDAKLRDAFALHKHQDQPGTKWVYQSSATFILTQAMSSYLKHRHGGDDLFDRVRDDLYKPLGFSAGGLTTIRTGNSDTGAPSGYYGLFFNRDDVAKIGDFLNNSGGAINKTQVLEPGRLNEALFRSPDPSAIGVPILGGSASSTLGPPQLGPGLPPSENTRRYAHGFWGKYVSTAEFPEYRCNFWVSLLSGYGGNVIALLPNGVIYYVFSDGREFRWLNPMREANKLAPICH